MQQQCSHGVRFPVVGSVVADGRTIDVFCPGDYAQAKQRLFQYAQSIPVNGAVKQEGMITNGERANHVVAGREARTAFAGRRGAGVASPFGGDTLDAGNGIVVAGGAGSDDVGVNA
jgi:hypothetical protein